MLRFDAADGDAPSRIRGCSGAQLLALDAKLVLVVLVTASRLSVPPGAQRALMPSFMARLKCAEQASSGSATEGRSPAVAASRDSAIKPIEPAPPFEGRCQQGLHLGPTLICHGLLQRCQLALDAWLRIARPSAGRADQA